MDWTLGLGSRPFCAPPSNVSNDTTTTDNHITTTQQQHHTIGGIAINVLSNYLASLELGSPFTVITDCSIIIYVSIIWR